MVAEVLLMHASLFSFSQIIASANYMLSELFQLDEPKKEESSESPLNENSDESYSEEEEEEEMPDSDENGSYNSSADPSHDNKAVAIIKSVGELSVPEKYKSIHQIRVSTLRFAFKLCHWKTKQLLIECIRFSENGAASAVSSGGPACGHRWVGF